MKIQNPLLFLPAVFLFATAHAQDGETDLSLTSDLVGTWEHVSSTYPSGDVVTYRREIRLLPDGTGYCTRFTDLDTLSTSFGWEVKDSVIYLFETNKRGKRITADAQYISALNPTKMYLRDAYGEDQAGRVCCYRRNSEAKF